MQQTVVADNSKLPFLSVALYRALAYQISLQSQLNLFDTLKMAIDILSLFICPRIAELLVF